MNITTTDLQNLQTHWEISEIPEEESILTTKLVNDRSENRAAIDVPSVADATWYRRLLFRWFKCWVRLFRKDSWYDLDPIRKIITGLWEDQKTHEKTRLSNGPADENRAIALQLIYLHHWAKATEILAESMLQKQPSAVFDNLDKHFEFGIKAAAASKNAKHKLLLRWLNAASKIILNNRELN